MAGLFDTRGGLTMIDRCEQCNEKLGESEEGVCQDCLAQDLKVLEGDDE